MSDTPRKIVVLVKCSTIELKLTLTPKFLAKPLKDALVTPFLGAYNKKMKDATPITADDLVRVEVDGAVVADVNALAGGLLKSEAPKVELFPPGSAPAASAEPMDVSDPAPAPAPEPAPAPAPEPTAVPTSAPAPAPAATASSGSAPKPMASNTMPKCRYGLGCRIIDPKVEGTAKSPIEEQHWYKFQHPCFWVCKDGHPELGPPGQLCPLHPRFGMHGINGRGGPCPPVMTKMIIPCTNMDPMHRKCFRHPEDDEEVIEVIDEAPDELDEQVTKSETPWEPPDCGTVSEEAGMEAKMAAVEAASEGDFSTAVAKYSTALASAPSALTYAKRAEALLKLGSPSAALADCEKALEINPDSAKTYKVAAKALTKMGDFAGAYAKLCTGNKIDEDEDSAALQKRLKAKCDKLKKIGEQRSKRADAAFTEMGLSDVWASLELDVLNRPKGGHGLEALKLWMEGDVVSLKARLGELGATEAQMEQVFTSLKAV